MDIDIKWKILIALYIEYQQMVPDNTKITAEIIEVPYDSCFFAGLRKLEIEGYIKGVTSSNSLSVFDNLIQDMGKIHITKDGIDFIEDIFKIKYFYNSETKARQMSYNRDNRIMIEMCNFAKEMIEKLITTEQK